MGHNVMFLPGGFQPAAVRYQALLSELGEEVEPVLKDLEVYSGAEPPPGYSVETEIAGIERAADQAGFERFHLYGYSGGGACALAYTSARPERVSSLALEEPAADFTNAEKKSSFWREMLALLDMTEEQRMREFFVRNLEPGVQLPPRPVGPPPPWMANRPAGLMAMMGAFHRFAVKDDAYRNFARPVHFVYGSLTRHEYAVSMRDRLQALFPDFTATCYEGRHGFDTANQAEPARLAQELRRHWSRAMALPA
ncbi:MAG: alpha/beta hydrolase [Candidatus Dormibacteraeota bacterium]|nr:alpha/beta hydrolase [Candidatus Dormibacteraeota bacterium]